MTENELLNIIGSPNAGDTLKLDTALLHDIDFARHVRTTFGSTVLRIKLRERPIIFAAMFLRIKGTIDLFGVAGVPCEAELRFDLPGMRLKVHALVPSASLSALLAALLAGRFDVPSVLDITTEPVDISIEINGLGAVAVVRTRAAALGTIEIEAHAHDERFELVVVVDVSTSLRFSSLVPALAPLDSLVPRDLELLLASSPAALALIEKITIPQGVEAVETGLIAIGRVPMEGLGLEILRQLVNLDHLDIRLSAGPLVFSGAISSPALPDINLLFITLRSPRILVTATPLTVGLHTGAHVNIIGGVPELAGDLRVDAGTGAVEAELLTAEPWRNPFGLPGLTAEKLAVKGRAVPTADVTLFGEVSLSKRDSTKRMAVAVTVLDGLPVMLAGRFNEPITLLDLVEVFFDIGIPVPNLFSIVQLRDLALSIVPPPTPIEIGGEHFDVGRPVQPATPKR